MKRVKKRPVTRWLVIAALVLVNVLQIAETWHLESRLAKQANDITDLQEVAVAQFVLFQAYSSRGAQ